LAFNLGREALPYSVRTRGPKYSLGDKVRNAIREAQRLYFRPLEVEDLDAVQGFANDPENQQYVTLHRPLSRGAEREWLESLGRKESEVVFGIALKEEGRLIGTCGLREIGLPNRAADLGIMIGEARFQGRGLGTEAMNLLLAYGFETLNLNRIGLRVYANNPRAIRCYEKCGFRREGVLREARWWAGRWWDVLQYGILAREWHTLPQSGAAK
jgi:RimJ/RimL family protein N-acetyltransferase